MKNGARCALSFTILITDVRVAGCGSDAHVAINASNRSECVAPTSTHCTPKTTATEQFYLHHNLLLFSTDSLLGFFLWHEKGVAMRPPVGGYKQQCLKFLPKTLQFG